MNLEVPGEREMLRRRTELVERNSPTVQTLIEEFGRDISKLYKDFMYGVVSQTELDTEYDIVYNELLAKLEAINDQLSARFKRDTYNLSPARMINFIRSQSWGNYLASSFLESDRDLAREVKLDAYREEIDKYIEQSRKLMDNIPPKLRRIIQDMKEKQSMQYNRLKEMAKVQHADRISNGVNSIVRDKLIGFANLGFPELKGRDGVALAAANISYFVHECLPRAFYCKLPSILSGVPHDICVFSAQVETGGNSQVQTRYMHISNLGKRVYNFKYKAWWGPMVRIIKDSAKFVNANMRVFILLRVGNASETVVNAVKSSGVVTSYNLPDAVSYKAYCDQLVVTRTLNFKAKRTAQRFVRNRMAKFLNTDKQIVQEIGDYMNIPK